MWTKRKLSVTPKITVVVYVKKQYTEKKIIFDSGNNYVRKMLMNFSLLEKIPFVCDVRKGIEQISNELSLYTTKGL